MIKPTVGRVVLLHNRPGNQAGGPEAALITYVHGDRCINVGGFNAQGSTISATSVSLLQDDDQARTSMYAAWMTYQKGQAAKTEALEAQLAEATPPAAA